MTLIYNIGEKQAWPKAERDHNEEVNETLEEERERESDWAGSGVQTEGEGRSNRQRGYLSAEKNGAG